MEWWQFAITTVVSSAFGVAVTVFVRNWLALKGGNYAIDKTMRTDAIAEYQEIIERQQEEITRQQEVITRMNAELTEKTRLHTICEIRIARLEVWAEHASDAIAGVPGIKFRPFPKADPGSQTHTPLPPERGGD